MGATKTNVFSASQNKMARILKALGHPARVMIIEILAREKSCIAKDFVGLIPLSQPTISQHLKELSNAKVIKTTVKKNTVVYQLNLDVFERINSFSQDIGLSIK